MTETKKANPNSMVRLTIILFAICAITALLLGLVNFITEERIADHTARKTAEALQSVLPADSYDELPLSGVSASEVTNVYSAGDMGHVVQLSVSGSQGMIDMVVGVAEGAVTGVSIIDMSETSGLGSKANEEDWRAQFIGAAGEVAVTKDGGAIDALTGATVTSRAVADGVNIAMATVAEIG